VLDTRTGRLHTRTKGTRHKERHDLLHGRMKLLLLRRLRRIPGRGQIDEEARCDDCTASLAMQLVPQNFRIIKDVVCCLPCDSACTTYTTKSPVFSQFSQHAWCFEGFGGRVLDAVRGLESETSTRYIYRESTVQRREIATEPSKQEPS